jgi:hypothetical protein
MAHYVIGDLHGHLNDYRRLLQNQALTDAADQWTGGTHQLWLIGDFFDRGDKGVECVELTMQLQRQARAVGGDVNAILGNHELMLLCAYKFGEQLTSSGVSAKSLWIRWGGIDAELARLKPEHIHWLERLPALQRVGDALLLHADAMFYVEHGRTVEAVNQRFFDLTQNSDLERWEQVLRDFSEHEAFSSLAMTGEQRASQLLKYYGARQLVHGHTPISMANGTPAHEVDRAWTYAGERCINVDGGIYLGGPGFVHELLANA